MFPIFLIQPPSEPDTCPVCHKEEDTALACRHCGHEYEIEEEKIMPHLLIILITILIFIFFALFAIWMFYLFCRYSDNTYLERIGEIMRYLWERIITRIF